MVQPKGEDEGEQPPVDAAEEVDMEGEGGGKVAEKGSKSSDGDAATDGKAGEEEVVVWEPCVHESGRLLRLCIVREEQGEPSVGDDGVETPGPVALVEVPFLYPVEATEEEKAEAAVAEAEAAAEAVAAAEAAAEAAREGGKEGEGEAAAAAEDSSEHKDAELKSDENGGGERSGDMNTTPPLKLVRSACVRTVDGAALFLPLELPSPRPEEDGEDAGEGKGGGGEGGEGGEGGGGGGADPALELVPGVYKVRVCDATDAGAEEFTPLAVPLDVWCFEIVEAGGGGAKKGKKGKKKK
jgi:hypothetical protein